MDRFIANAIAAADKLLIHLKSNMDRFIVLPDEILELKKSI